MKAISFQHVTKEYAHQLVLNECSFDIFEKRKYGLIGVNGSGKTTILRIIMGSEQADSGTVIRNSSLKIGYVSQMRGFAPEDSVMAALLAPVRLLENKLREWEEKLATADQASLDRILHQYQTDRDAFEEAGGDDAPTRVLKLLDQMGLENRQNSPVSELSGGELSILALLQVLLTQPNLLILDEPGNHLDYHGLARLEQFLSNVRTTVLIVSHNRYLLDRICTDIISLHDSKTSTFHGNYSAYKVQTLEKASAEAAAYNASQKKIAQITEMVQRMAIIAAAIPDPSWGRRLRAARSRLHQEQDRAGDKPNIHNKKIRPAFTTSQLRGDAAIIITNYSRSFANLQLYDKANLEIPRGSRFALLGANGTGKTTLIKDLVTHGSWDHPHLRIVDSLRVGHLQQTSQDMVSSNTLMDEVRSWGPISRDQALSLLLPLNFTFADMEKTCGKLSGGEINRLQIAKLMYQKPDILILDEPTNHLDIQSREALEDALEDYGGTLLVISHDRYFLERIVNNVAEIDNKKITVFPTGFSEYYHNRWGGRTFHNKSDKNASRKKNASRAQPPQTPQQGQSLAMLEARIDEAEREKTKIENDLGAALTRMDHRTAKARSAKLKKHAKLLEHLYARWESLSQ